MQVDDALGSRAQVQPVDVLGDHAIDVTARLELGDDEVAGIGPGSIEMAPPEVAAGPVALAVLGVDHELLKGHR